MGDTVTLSLEMQRATSGQELATSASLASTAPSAQGTWGLPSGKRANGGYLDPRGLSHLPPISCCLPGSQRGWKQGQWGQEPDPGVGNVSPPAPAKAEFSKEGKDSAP